MLVAFDLDDTLYLERDYARSGFRAVSEEVCGDGNGAFFDCAWKLFVAGNRTRIFDETLAHMGLPADPSNIQRLVAVYRNHQPDIALLPDALECLRQLSRDNDLALITDGYSSAQWQKITALGLRRLISMIIVTDDRGPDWWKPAPHSFVELQGGRPGAECVYIADNPRKDFVAPQDLGWKTIRIRRPDGLWENEPDATVEPDAVVTDLFSLAAVIHQLNVNK